MSARSRRRSPPRTPRPRPRRWARPNQARPRGPEGHRAQERRVAENLPPDQAGQGDGQLIVPRLAFAGRRARRHDRRSSDRLSVDPASPFYDEAALARGVGVRFRGVERRDVEEYCVARSLDPRGGRQAPIAGASRS